MKLYRIVTALAALTFCSLSPMSAVSTDYTPRPFSKEECDYLKSSYTPEINEILKQLIDAPNKQPLLLSGLSGVGKSTFAHHLYSELIHCYGNAEIIAIYVPLIQGNKELKEILENTIHYAVNCPTPIVVILEDAEPLICQEDRNLSQRLSRESTDLLLTALTNLQQHNHNVRLIFTMNTLHNLNYVCQRNMNLVTFPAPSPQECYQALEQSLLNTAFDSAQNKLLLLEHKALFLKFFAAHEVSEYETVKFLSRTLREEVEAPFILTSTHLLATFKEIHRITRDKKIAMSSPDADLKRYLKNLDELETEFNKIVN